MKNNLSPLFLILIIAPVFSACRGPKPKENEADVLTTQARLKPAAGEKYVLDTKESVVIYKGSMAMASKGSHRGFVYLSSGELLIAGGKLVGGTFEIDMNTIADEKHGSKNGLVDHLKSSDFFDVEKFPVSLFGISMIAPAAGDTVNVTGNLSIKGITHTITFPASIELKDGVARANGKITIDRTQWDVHYKSGKFLLNLADEVISDNIEFEMKIVTKKAGS